MRWEELERNKPTIKGNWNEVKGKEYADLTDDDLTFAEGKEDERQIRFLLQLVVILCDEGIVEGCERTLDELRRGGVGILAGHRLRQRRLWQQRLSRFFADRWIDDCGVRAERPG